MAFGFTSMDALLQRKYDIMAKNANAAMIRAKASANLNNAQAESIGKEAARLARQEFEESTLASQPGQVSLPAMNQLLGNQTQGGAGGLSPSGGALSGAGGIGAQTSPDTVGSPSTGTQPAQTTGQQPRTTTTAPQGFGLNRKPSGSVSVFGSVFDETRGLK